MTEWIAAFPLLFLLFGGLVVMIADAFLSVRRDSGELSALLLLLTALVSGTFLATGTGVSSTALAPYLAVDGFALLGDALLCSAGALSVLIASPYLRSEGIERGEYYVIVVFTTLGAMVLARATSTLSLFVGLEAMSLGVYGLVAFRRTSRASAEAGAKYFLLGSFAGALLLFGAALLYGATGHLDFAGIKEAIAEGQAEVRLLVFGMGLVLAGLLFKVSAAPFHSWAPDAYQGAILPTTGFMSVVVKAAAFLVFIRMFIVAFGDPITASASTGWPLVVALLAALTMVVGNVAGLWQSNIKRLLAYSSVAHAGYMLIGLTVSSQDVLAGTSAVVFYLMSYGAATFAVFGSLVLLGLRHGEIKEVDDLAGLGRRYPLAALPLLFGVLSLMGIPPTAGFFGKYYLFLAAFEQGPSLFWLVIVAVVSSAVSLVYYLKMLTTLYMKQAGETETLPHKRISLHLTFALVVSVYFVFKIGITPSAYLEAAAQAAKQL